MRSAADRLTWKRSGWVVGCFLSTRRIGVRLLAFGDKADMLVPYLPRRWAHASGCFIATVHKIVEH